MYYRVLYPANGWADGKKLVKRISYLILDTVFIVF